MMDGHEQETNPFGRGPAGSRRRLLARGGGAAVLVAATALTLYLSSDAPASAGTEVHDHGAAPAASTANPVTLTGEQAARIGVTYASATLAPMPREIRTVGQVTFDETRVRTIAPRVDGWVERLFVDATGQLVRAGQPLLSIYSPMLVAAQEELLLAARLAADVAGGSPEARAGAAELLASARRRLAYWEIPAGEIAAIEKSGVVRRAVTLRAPYGGHVLEKTVTAGQRVMMGEALYRLADLSTVWIEGEVFEQDLPAVSVGQEVAVELDATPGRDRRGRISYVYPTVNPETRTARVRVALANPGLLLKPGMYATLKVDGTRSASVLTVPRNAVLATGTRSVVFLRRADGVLEPRDVRVGVANDERIVILAGLQAGDVVVASATFLVDAESNLGALLDGGMGAMPVVPGAADPHAGHRP